MFGLGPSELIIIAVIILILFGAKRLPEIGKGLGGAVREFKNVKKELADPDSGKAEESKPPEETSGKTAEPPKALEEKLVDGLAGQVPGVRKAMDVREKAKKIKDILR